VQINACEQISYWLSASPEYYFYEVNCPSSINPNISSSSSYSITPITPSSSSSNMQEYAWCIFPEQQVCLGGPFTSCMANGLLYDTCPFETNSNGGDNPPSSDSSQKYAWCVFSADQMCLEGPFSFCPSSGMLSNSCPYNNISPTLTNKLPTNLTILLTANNLQISSNKQATVQLFNMQGVKVLNAKVAAGNSTISLEKQKKGVYYAVVRAGSNKQTVKVVVK
jgi:hypothetical protein